MGRVRVCHGWQIVDDDYLSTEARESSMGQRNQNPKGSLLDILCVSLGAIALIALVVIR